MRLVCVYIYIIKLFFKSDQKNNWKKKKKKKEVSVCRGRVHCCIWDKQFLWPRHNLPYLKTIKNL